MNELEAFLKGTEEQENLLDTPLEVQPEKVEEEEEEQHEEDISPKTRRERRLKEKLEAERQSAIDLANRLARLEEARSVRDEDAEYLKGIERIYGTDSPEAQMATELLTKAIVGARDDAERRAYERIQAERQNESQAVQQAESELDSIVDDIEDSYGVELTEAQERSYFELLQKMSPKDREGNVISLADPYAVFEIFSEKLQKGTDNRAKTLSSRSMVQSGATKDSTLKDDAMERYLVENGII
jgi:vacuolar-type H+-ATPase subunit I/STV1